MPQSTQEDVIAEGTAPAPQTRKQGVSCDACRFRKVKCDRRAKLEKRGDTSSDEIIACSLCIGHGLQCTFTLNPAAKSRTRTGRRIKAYVQGVAGASTDSGSTAQTSASSSGNALQVVSSDTPAEGNDIPYSATTSKGLFDVEGLTQPLLHACFQGFINYYAPCIFGLQSEVLAARYKLFFSTLHKNNGFVEPFWKTAPESSKCDDRPLSEVLILAVGCLGASLLEPPVAEEGSNAKFRLQDRLALKFQDLLDCDLTRRLDHQGTDVVEACYIMADPYLSVIGNTHGPNASADPFRIRPATPEGITRLLSRLSITRRPKLRTDCPPKDTRIWRTNGQNITEMEMFRRMRLFWTVFLQNAFRSMGDKTDSLIANDDFDWDLPRFVPRQDGTYDSLVFCERQDQHNQERKKDIVCLQANHFVEFDVIHFQVMLRLAFVIRTVSMKLGSIRCQGQSVLVSDVEKAVAALSAWYQQLPIQATWEAQIQTLQTMQSGGNEANVGSSSRNIVPMRNALKAFFVEILYHANVWNVWNSIESFGIRVDPDLADTTALLADGLNDTNSRDRSAASISIVATPDTLSSNIDQLRKQQSDQPNSRISRTKLENLIGQSFVRIAKISKEAAQLNLVRASRLVFAHVFRMYAKWGCNLARKIGSTKGRVLPVNLPPGCSEIDYIYRCVDDLIFALSAIDSCEQAKGMSFGLKKELEDCKVSNQTGNKMSSQSSANSDILASQEVFLNGNESGSLAGIDFETLARSLQSAQDTPVHLNLDSLSPVDLDWLQQYLSEQQQQDPVGAEGTTCFTNADTVHLNVASDDNSTDVTFADLYSFSSETDFAMNYSQDGQFGQFPAFSDAQDWANAQWQNITTDTRFV